MSSDNSIVSFIAKVFMSNRTSYLSSILYITNIQQCIKCIYDTSQENADIVICKYDARTNCCT